MVNARQWLRDNVAAFRERMGQFSPRMRAEVQHALKSSRPLLAAPEVGRGARSAASPGRELFVEHDQFATRRTQAVEGGTRVVERNIAFEQQSILTGGIVEARSETRMRSPKGTVERSFDENVYAFVIRRTVEQVKRDGEVVLRRDMLHFGKRTFELGEQIDRRATKKRP